MRSDEMKYLRVDTIPETLEPSVVYVSERFAMAAHLCACGCGVEVPVEIGPGKWSVRFDGDRITMHPSIGNGSHPCKSHYFITNGRVEWAGTYTPEMIASARRRDNPRAHPEVVPVYVSPWKRLTSWMQRLTSWVRRFLPKKRE